MHELHVYASHACNCLSTDVVQVLIYQLELYCKKLRRLLLRRGGDVDVQEARRQGAVPGEHCHWHPVPPGPHHHGCAPLPNVTWGCTENALYVTCYMLPDFKVRICLRAHKHARWHTRKVQCQWASDAQPALPCEVRRSLQLFQVNSERWQLSQAGT